LRAFEVQIHRIEARSQTVGHLSVPSRRTWVDDTLSSVRIIVLLAAERNETYALRDSQVLMSTRRAMPRGGHEPMRAVRIAVLDRRRLLRELLGRLLEAEPGITVVASAGCEADLPIDVGAFDLALVGAAEEPSGRRPGASRLVPFGDQMSVDDLVGAVLGTTTADHDPAAEPAARLTARQRDVLGGIAEGMRLEEIAASMGISPKSVDNHKQRIFMKLGVQSQAHAVAVALGMRTLPRIRRREGQPGA
jgi:DNA-binding NarL/FixJ family response regulator